jgi:hypothetical protein
VVFLFVFVFQNLSIIKFEQNFKILVNFIFWEQKSKFEWILIFERFNENQNLNKFNFWTDFEIWTNFECEHILKCEQILKCEWIPTYERILKFERKPKFERISKCERILKCV